MVLSNGVVRYAIQQVEILGENSGGGGRVGEGRKEGGIQLTFGAGRR